MKITAGINWTNDGSGSFTTGQYSRVHCWSFDGGVRLAASSSPEVVPLPFSDPSLIDPEEAFLASISACHMLFFLSIASKRKFIVRNYEDSAVGMMGMNDEGKKAFTGIELHPKIEFDPGNIPGEEIIQKMHELAHASCFLANSIKAAISIVQP